jgi:hypothetical protein
MRIGGADPAERDADHVVGAVLTAVALLFIAALRSSAQRGLDGEGASGGGGLLLLVSGGGGSPPATGPLAVLFNLLSW